MTPTLPEFLLARIAEDEAKTIGHIDSYVQRERAECEAKRRIAGRHMSHQGIGPDEEWRPHCDTLRFLALPYADHPDHRQEWKP